MGDCVVDGDCDEVDDCDEFDANRSVILYPCGALDAHKDNGYDDEERRDPDRDIEE